MANLSPELQEFLQLLEKGEKMIAMLAPSFPIDFPQEKSFVGQLKRLGFKYVVEVARGAVETNHQLLRLMKKNPDKRYITNPCPTLVWLIRNKYPQLVKFLSPIDSPMQATAKIVRKEYFGYRPVFIGPCIAKKLEAREDCPDLNILVLTFKEIQTALDKKNIQVQPEDQQAEFDLVAPETRLYPISGGLAQSACVKEYMDDDQVEVLSGIQLVEESLREFEKNENMKLLDVLNCHGGCVGGPGVIGKLPLEERRQRVVDFWIEQNQRK